MKRTRHTRIAFALALACAMTGLAAAVPGQESPPAEAPRLDTSQIEAFMGEWVLEVLTQQGSLNSLITFSDDDGKASADFYLARLADVVIENISRTETGVLLKWNLDFGGQLVPVEMDLAREGDGLAGKLEAGFFNADVKGVTKEAAEAAGIIVERQPVGDDDDLALSRVEVEGQAIRLRVDRLQAPGPDYDKLESLADGEVLGPIYGKPFKFWTDADLAFEDVEVAAHNHGPTYPGVYSLWLKREEDGWKLVFNHLADVWGTMHMAEHDAGETPLAFRTLAEPAEHTEGVLEIDGAAGMLTIRWGTMEWSAPFQIAE
ncbi:MAG: DUF2911 domain-containing protein [Acidobacteria bacterium]|nr:DUF2911 domain-containing protein [Acidobacteriota bacterium]